MASFIAGPYTVAYNALALGILEDGITLEATQSTEAITGDNLGDSIQDAVYRGGNVFLDMVLQQFDAAGAQSAFWPYEFANWGNVGQIGTLSSDWSKPLVLTSVAGTSAVPAVLTVPNVILAPNYPVRMLFASRLRNVPIRFQVLPTPRSSGDPDPYEQRWFKEGA